MPDAEVQQGPEFGLPAGGPGLGGSLAPADPRALALTPDRVAFTRGAKPVRKQRRGTSCALRNALDLAAAVTDSDIDRHKPTPEEAEVALALLTGAVTQDQISTQAGLSLFMVRRVMASPISMAWISRQVARQFEHRAAMVDAALYLRAVGGDVQACRLFYDRFQLLQNEKRVKIEYSGGVDLRAVDTEELARIVADRARMLPVEFTVMESKDAAGSA